MTNDIRITEQRAKRFTLSDAVAVILSIAVIAYVVLTMAARLTERSEALLVLGNAKTARIALVAVGKKAYAAGGTLYDPAEPNGIDADAYDEALALYEYTGSAAALSFDESGTVPTVFIYTEGEFTAVCRFTGEGTATPYDSFSQELEWTVYRVGTAIEATR